MSDLLIRNIPKRLKSNIEKRAQDTGRSLSDEAKALLQKGLTLVDNTVKSDGETAYDRMRAHFADAQMSDEEHNAFMNAVEDGRTDMGRAAPDFE